MNFEKPKNEPESKVIDKNSNTRSFEKGTPIDHVVTEKGSEYKYLPDGRTQRFKKIEGKNYEPQDAIVFVPDYEWIQKNAPKHYLDNNTFGENETQYNQILLEYVQKEDHGKDCGKKVYIEDEQGNKLESNQEIAIKNRIFLWFGKETEDGKYKEAFCIPVINRPTIGFSTFDTRKYKEGYQWLREKHLGNKVIEIVRK